MPRQFRPTRHSTELAQLFDPIPNPFVPFVPHFRHVLVDLAVIPDGELSGDPHLRAELLVMKRILQEDLPERARDLVAEVLVLERVELRVTLTYIAEQLGEEDLLAVLSEVHLELGDQGMGDFFDDMQEEFRRRGRAEGKAEGKAETLTRLLARRFGPLGDGVKARIAAADGKTLDRWLDRVLDAPDLDGVLGKPRKGRSG